MYSTSSLAVTVVTIAVGDGDVMETDDTKITNINLGNSYRCDNGITYNLTSNDNSVVSLTLTNLQLQAFNFTKPKEFGKGLLVCIMILECY